MRLPIFYHLKVNIPSGNPCREGAPRLPEQDDAPLPLRPAPVQVRPAQRAEARPARRLQTLRTGIQGPPLNR